jgi:hypothetical protein
MTNFGFCCRYERDGEALTRQFRKAHGKGDVGLKAAAAAEKQ